MKRVFSLLVLLTLTACVTTPSTLLPVNTVVALTMEAIPKTDTPLPALAPSSTLTLPAGATLVQPTGLGLTASGAQCVPTHTQRTKALVTRVVDGDKIEVVIGYDMFIVKYIGLNAPGVALTIQWQGPQAIAANERLVKGQTVVLVKDVTDIDANGFLPRYVLAGSVFVNYELVSMGYARVVSMPPDVACDVTLLSAQAVAKTALQGLWAPTPIPTATITPTPTQTLIPSFTPRPVCKCDARLTCKNFLSQADAQACFNYCESQGITLFNLDKNGNGTACEGS